MDNRPSRAYLRSLQTRYRRARKKAKGVILDEFTQTTGCGHAGGPKARVGRTPMRTLGPAL